MTVLIFGLHEGVTSARRGIIVSFVSVQHCYGSDIYGHVFFLFFFYRTLIAFSMYTNLGVFANRDLLLLVQIVLRLALYVHFL